MYLKMSKPKLILGLLFVLLFGNSANAQSSATASFLGFDITTQGNWQGIYGADGYSIANDSQSIPSYASFAVQNQSNYTWASGTSDQRALVTGNGSSRIAATWYSSSSFVFDINLTDGNCHQLALYALDWDTNARSQTIRVLDATTQAVLDSRSISSFSNGLYVAWKISGHVRISITWTSGWNAVISGVFWDSATNSRQAISNVTPSTGWPGTQVTITGANLGTAQGTVGFNGTPATVTSWANTQIVATVPVGATTGFVTATAGGANVTLTVPFTVFPPGWSNSDVGAVGPLGSASYANGAFTIQGSGLGTSSNSDAFHFVYQPLSGDGTIVARATSLQGGVHPMVGVMIRETLDPAATYAQVGFYNGNVQFWTRASSGAYASVEYSSVPGLPYWVKVVRSGNTFSGYASSDGVNWWQEGSSQTISMAQDVYVGLEVSSYSTSSLATATVDSVSVSSSASAAPTITAISATTGSIGSQVYIIGSGFDASQDGSAVLLSDAPATINAWSNTAIILTIPTGATSGPLLVSVAPTMNNSNAIRFTVTAQPLPTPWLDQDVGEVGPAGSATYSNGSFTINGAGYGIFTSPPDGFHFVYQPLSGDGTIVARLVSLQGGVVGRGGVQIRETLDPGARYAAVVPNAASPVFYYRTTPGTTGNDQYVSFPSTASWIKLVRSGNTFSGFASLDGVNWVQLGTSQTITMATIVYVGLYVDSYSSTALTTGAFDGVSLSTPTAMGPVISNVSATTGSIGSEVVITGSGFGSSQNGSAVTLNDTPVTINSWSNTSITITIPVGATSGPLLVSVAPNMDDSNAVNFQVTTQPLPVSWLDQDVGATGPAGSATYANGTFTVKGAGTGTWNSTSDQFHFVYQPLPGDGTIIARIVSLQGGTYPSAGVMMRETLDPAATNAQILFSNLNPNTIYMQQRTSSGGAMSIVQGISAALPYWTKLVRSGSLFTGYVSPDGANWTLMGTPQTISMAQDAYVGLYVDSVNNQNLTTATFDNISLTIGTTPYVSGLSPTFGPLGTQLTITGSSFGTSPGTVSFNGAVATSIASWTNSQIVANVPANAPGGVGPVTVTVNSIPSLTDVAFDVINPMITSLSPPAAAVGGTVILSGIGFGASQGTSQVQLNGVVAAVRSWSDTSVSVLVPSTATNGPVTLTEDGITSNGVQFSLLEPLSVTGISPNIGKVGDLVTISGTGFGATQANSTVDFFGTPAVVQSWSDTQIVVTVPQGMTSGSVDVSVASITWYGPHFTITQTLQLTDSKGNQSSYTSAMTGGKWVPLVGQGSGCSSCTQRGNISYTYGSYGHPLSRTDENGNTTTYTYDSNGNVSTVTVPISSTVSATTTYTYNSFGEVLTATNPLGNVTTNTYDANGNLLSVTTPAPGSGASASVTHFAYNTLGELTSITDPLNNGTSIAYTSAGLIHTITDAEQNVTTYGYDSQGNRTSVTDALNHQTTFTYDAMSRLTKITYPDSTYTQFGYDSRGRRTSVQDQNGKTTTYAYDDADRLITVTDAANNVTTYGYDTENNLTSIQDANQNTTSFSYDAFGRVTQTSFPSGYVETYGYDNVGNLTSKTDRKNQLITYTYDQLNRLTQKSYPDTSTVNYTYDNDSRLTQVTDPTGTYQFTFDNMGRLTATSTQYAFLTSRTFTTSYGYDAASNRISFTDPENGSSSYVYDTLNRLQTLTPPAAYGTGSFGLGYDALSRRTSLTRPNTVNTTYGYDNLSRLLSVTHSKGGVTLDGATYTVDNAGNRTTKSDLYAGVTTNYGYDNIYELLSATQGGSTTESYTYDYVGNRLTALGSAAWSYNTSNELNSRPGVSYAFDANGNTIVKTDSTGTTTYAWDYDNRLTSVTLPGSGGTVSFKYDPMGRRIYKSSSSGTSIYAYDGNNLVEETNSSGAVAARYSQGLHTDEPLAVLRSGATSYYQADGLGSLTSLSNASGTLANTYTYDSFGNLVASSGNLVNNFRYTGREFDTETNLYYYRARYFDPQAGRFLNEDPIRFAGSINFYSYVSNNPALRIDPSGLIHQAWNEPPYDGRLHDDAAGGLEVLCTKGRNIQQDKGWLLNSIAVRFVEIVREGENADLGHIGRLVLEGIALARCNETCGDEKPEPEPAPDNVNEQNWWQQFQQFIKQNPFLPIIG